MTSATEKKAVAVNHDAVFEPVHRLTRDLRNASITLTTTEARFLIDAYRGASGMR